MAEDRDLSGRFTEGNQAAVGQRGWGKVSKLRAAVLDCTTTEQVQRVMAALYGLAINGDTRAATIWLDRVGIRPESIDLEERVSEIERVLQGQHSHFGGSR